MNTTRNAKRDRRNGQYTLEGNRRATSSIATLPRRPTSRRTRQGRRSRGTKWSPQSCA